MGKSVKVYRVFNEDKEIAIGTPREIAEQLNVATATVGSWVFRGKQEKYKNSGYKYALFDSELSQMRFPEHYSDNPTVKQGNRLVRVFELYIYGSLSYSGTIREISDYTSKKISGLYHYISKDNSINFEKKYTLIEVGTRNLIDEQQELNDKQALDSYNVMSKEERAERRYKRKLKMKMMIEKMQKEELGKTNNE